MDNIFENAIALFSFEKGDCFYYDLSMPDDGTCIGADDNRKGNY